jgi:hypothetical protein
LRRKIVNLRRSGLEFLGAGLEEAKGVDPPEAHDFELFLEGGNGRACKFMGGLLGITQGGADFTVGLAVTDALGHEAETRRQGAHRRFEAFPGLESRGVISQGPVTSWNLLNTGFLRGGGLGNWKVEIVHVATMMPHLAFVKIPQSVSHGAGGIGIEVALGRIKKASRVGERLLGGQFNFSMGQTGDVGELPRDLGREGKEVIYP